MNAEPQKLMDEVREKRRRIDIQYLALETITGEYKPFVCRNEETTNLHMFARLYKRRSAALKEAEGYAREIERAYWRRGYMNTQVVEIGGI